MGPTLNVAVENSSGAANGETNSIASGANFSIPYFLTLSNSAPASSTVWSNSDSVVISKV